MTQDITSQDGRKRRCPMLGHDIHFSYCRAPGRDLPCRKIFDCWFEAFDVQGFIRAHFTEADIDKILAPRRDKLTSILKIVENAKRARDEHSGNENGDKSN